jgi:hypothetical protein
VVRRQLPSECGERRRAPPVNVGHPEGPEEYSGFLIVRLSDKFLAMESETLMEVAKELQLEALLRLLEQFDLSDTRRVVRSLPAREILELEEKAARTDLPPLHSLTAYWRIDARHRWDQVDEILKSLNALFEVDLAYKEFAVSDPAVDATDDTYADDQDYLDAAPTGIDARWAWTQANGEGSGVAVIDLEQGWFLTHEDLVDKSPSLIYGDNRDGVDTYKGNHGTAVLGQIVGVDNDLGIVGIAPGVTSVDVVSHYDAGTDTALHVADAIVAAIVELSAGDVLLLEVQRSYKPTEIDDADFDAIRLAVAHAIIVVEAAGNGGTDLDDYTDSAGDKILNRDEDEFRESGAIMVGASESALPHDRWTSSNYGSRIDCYGWGEDITTAGYGDLDAGTGDDSTYTDTFGGTSGASPMVTGAALILQGMYEATTGTRLSPGQMRALLSDPATGTDQGPNTPGEIGVMPDLRAIIEDTLGLVPDVYLRDNVGDTGAVPSAGNISTSPDVIVRPVAVADPTAAFGEGSGTENSVTEGFEVEAGQDNFIYVRMKNRGASDADDVTATVYWSEVATLITPDVWNLIDTSDPVTVPQGDTLVVADPITWSAGDIPATGHYCFVALLDHPQDPRPPLPPGPPDFDWDDFRSFIRNHNNVTWHNFNVIDDIPDPSGDPAELPFLIAGAPDRARIFDLEIVQKLPRGAEVWLEVPLILAQKVSRGRLLSHKTDRRKQVARVRLPARPRIPLCGVRLAAGGRYPARLFVHGAKGMERGGHSIAIRQLFEGEEVGRVTWQFHRRREYREKAR